MNDVLPDLPLWGVGDACYATHYHALFQTCQRSIHQVAPTIVVGWYIFTGSVHVAPHTACNCLMVSSGQLAPAPSVCHPAGSPQNCRPEPEPNARTYRECVDLVSFLLVLRMVEGDSCHCPVHWCAFHQVAYSSEVQTTSQTSWDKYMGPILS